MFGYDILLICHVGRARCKAFSMRETGNRLMKTVTFGLTSTTHGNINQVNRIRIFLNAQPHNKLKFLVVNNFGLPEQYCDIRMPP